MMMEAPVYLFISPHLDDVALSCGGYARQLVKAGKRVVIATIFTADLPAGQPLSWLMRSNHIRWGAGDAPFQPRRAEDASAARLLGAEYAHLGLLDAMYRRSRTGQPFYKKDTVLIPVDPEDQAATEPLICQALEQLMERLGAKVARVFCPLGIGEHVDHILTRRVVERIIPPGKRWYYEEFPYVTRPNALETWAAGQRAAALEPVITALAEDEIESHLSAIKCYTSQTLFLFPTSWQSFYGLFLVYIPWIARFFPIVHNPEDTARRISITLRDYLDQNGGERFWVVCDHSANEALTKGRDLTGVTHGNHS